MSACVMNKENVACNSCPEMSAKAQDFSDFIAPTQTMYPSKMSLEEIEVCTSPCLHDDIDSAVAACVNAQKEFCQLSLARRSQIIDSIRTTCMMFAEDFALAAYSETGRGRFEDKVTKQKLAINSTPGMEDLKPICFSGDHGLTTIDFAPFGVIGAVTPVTNPTATVINNSITILSGGNGVVFNPHPGAMKCTNRAIHVVNQAIRNAGGPCCLVASVKIPTIPSGQRLMTHPDTACNLITGGPAVVKLALQSGKRSFCAGPGNPPVVVDETADLAVAARAIYDGASFDNNMICSDEKQTFVVESVFDKLMEEFVKCGAYRATAEEIEKLTAVCVPISCSRFTHGEVDKYLVGQDASVLMEKIGSTGFPETCRLIIAEVSECHPLVWTEQLMPIMPVVRCANFEKCVELAKKSEYGYKHTASIYSNNMHRVTVMAREMNTTLFIVNGSHTAGLAAGGEGYTSFSIAGTTGEGMTRPSTFVRERRLVCVNALRHI